MTTLPYIPPERIAELKEIDLLSYLKQAEPDELITVGNNYFTRTHDSLSVSENGFWHWQSRHIGGTTALQYLIIVRGMSFLEAAHYLQRGGIKPIYPHARPKDPEQRENLVLPKAYTNNNIVINYLLSRAIHPEIIKYCIDNYYLYEGLERDKKGGIHHNAVFVGYNAAGIPRYAFIRGTGSGKYAREETGSEKQHAFSIPAAAQSNILIKSEAAIDALSLATLAYLKDPAAWLNYHYLSGGGASVKPVDQYLTDHPEITEIRFCNDNDEAGRAMTAKQKAIYEGRGYIVKDTPPKIKGDYNDYINYIYARTRRKIPARPFLLSK